MAKLYVWILERLNREPGQGLIEYAGIAGLIALAIAGVTALGLLTGPLTDLINGIGDCVDWDSGSACGP